MFYILLALREERCGVDIMAAVEELSRGRIRVGSGTLYAMLPRFENAASARPARRAARSGTPPLPRAFPCLMRRSRALR